MPDGPLVSIVIPAFNAADTLGETLASVSRQTYDNLDIIVIDDGSTDQTSALVEDYCLRDPRARLIRQPNGGVASARNRGIDASQGAFVAFIDADDLWHPTKIAKQLKVLTTEGGKVALVYSPFRIIDVDGRVLASPPRFGASGWVLYRHFHLNLIGNGSSILVRKDVLEEVGGFDPVLRNAGAEGCEDLLLQLRIAARYQFGEVPEYLVGYRRHPKSMSSNVDQMLRSGALAMRIALSECAGVPHLTSRAVLNRYEWQRLRNAIRAGQIGQALRHLWSQFICDPKLTALACWNDLCLIALRADDILGSRLATEASAGMRETRRHFYDFDPAAGSDRTRPKLQALRRLARLDEGYQPTSRIPRQI